MAAAVAITVFTDPACPFAFSAEPRRLALRWHYGEQLTWAVRMIGLTLEDGEAARLAEGAPGLQQAHGMPIWPGPYPREASSLPACRAVVAARLHAPDRCERLLRAFRVRTMAGGLLDDPALLAGAARDAGLDPGEVDAWAAGDDVAAAFAADVAAARAPAAAARGPLDHRLSGPAGERRYSAPSYELRAGEALTVIPGFNPLEVYEVALANLAPGLVRRPRPDGVEEVLAWTEMPLATAEIVALTGLDAAVARAELGRCAHFSPAGADGYWTRG